MRENVITVPHIANSRAFTPVLVNRRLIKEAGVDVRIFYEDKPEMYDADCVIFDGWIYRKWSEGDNERGVTSFLERLNRRIETTIWFDTTDGTGTTQFQFLPYFDKYLKLQVLRDRSLYQKRDTRFREIYENVSNEDVETLVCDIGGVRDVLLEKNDHGSSKTNART